jgi:alpha-2-macroglobulin
MASPATSTARLRSTRSLWLKMITGWVLLAMACSLPANPFTPQSPVSAEPTPTATLLPLPTAIPQVSPAIVETRPLPGSTVDLHNGLTFYFNQPMDRASVEAAFQTDPGVEGLFAWQDDATLQFLPSAVPPTGALQVRLDASARAQNGLALLTAPNLVYLTPGRLELVETQPADKTRDVSPSTPIVVTFNQPVVPLSAEERSMPSAFTIEPDVPGRGEWINTSTYVYYPEPALAGGVEYTVRLNPDLTATTGAALASEGENYSWTFRTTPPRLLELLPESSSVLLLDDVIELVFNQPMDTASVEEHFSLLDARGSRVSGAFEWHDGDTRVVFTPASLLNRSSLYTLVLAEEARSLGGAPLGQQITAKYSTFHRLDLVRRSPAEGVTAPSWHGMSTIALEFNAPLDEAVFEEHFQFDPPVDELQIHHLHTYDPKMLIIHAYLDLSAEYTLTVAGSLRDRWGQPMGQPLVLPILTSAAKPALNIPLLEGAYTDRLVFMLPGDAQVLAEANNLITLQIGAAPLDTASALAVQDDERQLVPDEEAFERWQQPLELPLNRPQNIEIPLAEGSVDRQPGLYYIQLRSPEFISEPYDDPLDFIAVVSRIQMVLKQSQTELFLWALDAASNQPVSGFGGQAL